MLCYAFGCNHKSTDGTCHFKMFPVDKKTFKKWEDMSRRQDSRANEHSCLCSCHFEGGDFSKTPSIFAWSKTKFMSPEKRTRKRRAPKSSESSDEAAAPATPSADPVETLMKEVAALKLRVAELERQNDFLQNNPPPKSYQHVKGTSYVYYYTGLQQQVFEQILLWFIKLEIQYIQGWNVLSVTKEDQVFLTFMKLRCNFQFTDLACRYSISEKTVSNIFYTWLEVLHHVLFPLVKMPSTAKNKLCLPTSFNKYTNCRVVVDCTEIESDVPRQSMDESCRLYSSYKSRHTFKFLVGCAPNGAITFVSEGFPGNTSDKVIFQKSGINDLLVEGDMILADKEFLISDVVPPGVSVNLPHFLLNKQFTPLQVKHNYEVANSRIIIERVNSRIKNFNIDNFPHQMRPHATKIFQTVCCLVNLQNPLIADIPARKQGEKEGEDDVECC